MSLISIPAIGAWHIILRCTDTVAYARILEPTTNIWTFEYSFNGGKSWTWCLSSVTGNVEMPFIKNPDHMLFRARKDN